MSNGQISLEWCGQENQRTYSKYEVDQSKIGHELTRNVFLFIVVYLPCLNFHWKENEISFMKNYSNTNNYLYISNVLYE